MKEFPCSHCGEPIESNNKCDLLSVGLPAESNNNKWGGMCRSCYEDLNPSKEDPNMSTNDNPTQFDLETWLDSLTKITVSIWRPERLEVVTDHRAKAQAMLLFQAVADKKEKELFGPGGIHEGIDRILVTIQDPKEDLPLAVNLLRASFKKRILRSPELVVDRFAYAIPFWDHFDATQTKANPTKKEKKAKKDNNNPNAPGWFARLKAWIKQALKKAFHYFMIGGLCITRAAWMSVFVGTTLIELIICLLLEGLLWYLAIVVFASTPWVLWVLVAVTACCFLYNLATETQYQANQPAFWYQAEQTA